MLPSGNLLKYQVYEKLALDELVQPKPLGWRNNNVPVGTLFRRR